MLTGRNQKARLQVSRFLLGENVKKRWFVSLQMCFLLQETVRNTSGAKRAILPQAFDCSSLSRSVPTADLVMSPMVFKVTTT